jgi:HD superfamily phosphohydrolase
MQARRMRNISLSVLPNELLPRGPIASRFQHGMGVAYLTHTALDHNRSLTEEERQLLAIAALLHDCGNPPFAHLSEPFLRKIHFHDGESFLSVLLDGTDAERVLRELGHSVADVVALTTGKTELAKILCGSMDVDNLDNIKRYDQAFKLHLSAYKPRNIAALFRFEEFEGKRQWVLPISARGETERWQEARAAVYQSLYEGPDFVGQAMLYRALELAYMAGELTSEFFFLDDYQAFEWLLTKSGRDSRTVAECAATWRWYDEAFTLCTKTPSGALRAYANMETARDQLSREICKTLHIPAYAVATYISTGKRDNRRVHLPFISANGDVERDTIDVAPTYRVRVFLHPDCARSAIDIHMFLADQFS